MKPSLIVYPVSYSRGGKSALATAAALARASGADLHVLELTGRRRSSEHPIVRSIAEGGVEPHFAEFVRSIYSADVKISAVELAGDVVDAVVEYARSTSADLVVVADQARSHGPYWRRGTYANDLARRLSVPLVSVPALAGEQVAHESTFGEQAKSYAETIAAVIVRSAAVNTSNVVEGGTCSRAGAIHNGNAEQGRGVVVIGRSGAQHDVPMNSPLARVLRESPRPVLILPAA